MPHNNHSSEIPCRLITVIVCLALLLQSGPAMADPTPSARTHVRGDSQQAAPATLGDANLDTETSAAMRPATAPAEGIKLAPRPRRASSAADGAALAARATPTTPPLHASAAPLTPAPKIAYVPRSSPIQATPQPDPAAARPADRFPPVPPTKTGPGKQAQSAWSPLQGSNASARAEVAAAGEISLVVGWNLISIPLVLDDPRPVAALAPIAGKYDQVFAYDACDPADPWKEYDPADPTGSDLTAIGPNIGFWINMTVAATLKVSGAAPVGSTIPLCAGWNLIGYPWDQPFPVPRRALRH